MINVDSNEYYEKELLEQIEEYEAQKVISRKEAGLALATKVFLFENFGMLNKETSRKLRENIIRKFRLDRKELEKAVWKYALRKEGDDEYYESEIIKQIKDFSSRKTLSQKEAGVILWVKLDLIAQFLIIPNRKRAYKLSKEVEQTFGLDFDEMFGILG